MSRQFRANLVFGFVCVLATPVLAGSQPAVIDVGTEAELREAIFQASNDLATDGIVNLGRYTINIIGPITLTQSLPMIRTNSPVGGEPGTVASVRKRPALPQRQLWAAGVGAVA